ncbi:hypothetical protein ACFL5Z_12920 [Planctomycetota bacterium]
MISENNQDVEYRLLKALRGGIPVFVNMTDNTAIEEFRNRYGNQDLFISTWSSADPDLSAPRKHSLRFHFVAGDVEKVRRSALEGHSYITEYSGVPDEYVEIRYNGGGEIRNNVDPGAGINVNQTGADDANRAGENNPAGPNMRENGHFYAKTCQEGDDDVHIGGRANGRRSSDDKGSGADENANRQQKKVDINAVAGPKSDCNNLRQNSPDTVHGKNSFRGSNNAGEDASTAEIVILIHPIVFGGQSTAPTLAINYLLARQMVDDGLSNVDFDGYVRDSYFSLPNSIHSATGRFVIPLTFKELLYLDGNRIAELSIRPRPDDSMIMSRRAPEAVEWFDEIHAEFEKKRRRQNELRRLVLKDGWEIPPCIRRLLWLDADESTILEACRIISGTFSFLGSNEAEIRYHIQRLARRNAINGFNEHQRLKAIVTFGVENPMLADCQQPLLYRYCPGRCFVADLIEEYEKPYLFEQV